MSRRRAHPLRAMLRADRRMLRRHGIAFLYVFLALLYAAALRFLAPDGQRPLLTALLLLTDPATLSLFFMGAVVLYEKDQHIHAALYASAVRPRTWLLSKCLTLALLGALAGCFVLWFSQPTVLRLDAAGAGANVGAGMSAGAGMNAGMSAADAATGMSAGAGANAGAGMSAGAGAGAGASAGMSAGAGANAGVDATSAGMNAGAGAGTSANTVTTALIQMFRTLGDGDRTALAVTAACMLLGGLLFTCLSVVPAVAVSSLNGFILAAVLVDVLFLLPAVAELFWPLPEYAGYHPGVLLARALYQPGLVPGWLRQPDKQWQCAAFLGWLALSWLLALRFAGKLLRGKGGGAR